MISNAVELQVASHHCLLKIQSSIVLLSSSSGILVLSSTVDYGENTVDMQSNNNYYFNGPLNRCGWTVNVLVVSGT